MWYELWSLSSRNLMHDFESLAEAVIAVRDYLADGALTSDQLGLVEYDGGGSPTRSITGPELAALASEIAREPHCQTLDCSDEEPT